MHQEHHAHQRDNEAFLQQRALQGFDGAMDEVGTVIDGLDAYAFRQAAGYLGNFVFDVFYNLQRILAIARHDDAGHHFAFAVQFSKPPPLVRTELDARDVRKGQLLTLRTDLDDDLLELALLDQAEREVKEIEAQYTSGLVTQGERYNKVVDIWGKTGDEVGKVMMSQLSKEKVVDRNGKDVEQEVDMLDLPYDFDSLIAAGRSSGWRRRMAEGTVRSTSQRTGLSRYATVRSLIAMAGMWIERHVLVMPSLNAIPALR